MPLSIIKRIEDKKIIDKIQHQKDLILKKIDHDLKDFYWFFGLHVDHLDEKKFIAVPCIGSDQFNLFDDLKLNEIVELFKSEGGEKLYLSSLTNLQNDNKEDIYFEFPCTLNALKEIDANPHDFRFNGYYIIAPENFNFFILMEWDYDIIIGRKHFVEKYFDNNINQELSKFELEYEMPIKAKRQLILDLHKNLTSHGYKFNI